MKTVMKFFVGIDAHEVCKPCFLNVCKEQTDCINAGSVHEEDANDEHCCEICEDRGPASE
jgi:hypothetical protein